MQIFVTLFNLEVSSLCFKAQKQEPIFCMETRECISFLLTCLFSIADVDECATGIAVCPRFRKCVNTFGSYICKCHEGFDLQYINGKYQCFGTATTRCYTSSLYYTSLQTLVFLLYKKRIFTCESTCFIPFTCNSDIFTHFCVF